MLGFGLCLWQHNVGSQIPPHVCCRTVQRMGSTSLEGTIVMQVKGGNETRLSAGETFYESPADIHTVSRNASDTERAKFLVFFVKDRGAPASMLVAD